ncbi:epimerase [Chromatium weissei]|nr:epimerase [Chromatium weissei]
MMNICDVPVLVTGATGKLGQHLVSALLTAGARVFIATRHSAQAMTLWSNSAIEYRYADLTDETTLHELLNGIEIVFHLASYSPPAHSSQIYDAPAHWTVTALGTRNLTAVAATSAVRGVVYASSVKVMGDAVNAQKRSLTECDVPQPNTEYGRAKRAAECSVLALGRNFGKHVSVLRLPMVYGISHQGNVAQMFNAIARHRFPPWPQVENRRSAVHVNDAIRALLLLATDSRADGQIYFVTDGCAYSTRWLYERMCVALGRPLPRWTLPLWTLRSAATVGSLLEQMSGRGMPLNQDGLAKLLGDAWYSSEKLQRELDFIAEHDLEQEIVRMAAHFKCVLS